MQAINWCCQMKQISCGKSCPTTAYLFQWEKHTGPTVLHWAGTHSCGTSGNMIPTYRSVPRNIPLLQRGKPGFVLAEMCPGQPLGCISRQGMLKNVPWSLPPPRACKKAWACCLQRWTPDIAQGTWEKLSRLSWSLTLHGNPQAAQDQASQAAGLPA